mmetsp:Transcript_18840/g.52555  ORF Transcript_18840/g.52555 Transcript_18840/m.52555 type:complete len:821 (+) Transcript_18840:403-2865(+)
MRGGGRRQERGGVGMPMGIPVIIAAIWTLLILPVNPVAGLPEQLSIQVSQNKDEMVVFWMTDDEATSVVQYGLSPDDLTETTAPKEDIAQRYDYRGWESKWYHRIHLRRLKPDTLYYYRAGDDKYGFSDVRWFKTRLDDPDATVVIAALGDQDYGIDATRVRNGLLQEQSEYDYDFLIHAGDISYGRGNQTKWDEWGNWWTPFASHYPVMYALGDYDVERGEDTSAYKARCRHSLGTEQKNSTWSWQDHWYSFDYGPVHLVFLSSEDTYSENLISEQAFWLERVLQEANNPEKRKRVPWIILVLHRPMHNNPPARGSRGEISPSMKKKFEPLLRKYRVNVVVAGHCHNYERTFPIFNETITQYTRGWPGFPHTQLVYSESSAAEWGTIHTTVGTAGRPVENLHQFPLEMERPCIVRHTNGNEDENYIKREDDCSNGCWSTDWTSYMNTDRGFGVFEVNRTMLYFQFFSVVQNRVIDEYVVCALPGCASPKSIKEEEKEPAKTANTSPAPKQWQAPLPPPPPPPRQTRPPIILPPDPVISSPMPLVVEVDSSTDQEDPLNSRHEEDFTDYPTEFPTPSSTEAQDLDQDLDLSMPLSSVPLAEPTSSFRAGATPEEQGYAKATQTSEEAVEEREQGQQHVAAEEFSLTASDSAATPTRETANTPNSISLTEGGQPMAVETDPGSSVPIGMVLAVVGLFIAVVLAVLAVVSVLALRRKMQPDAEEGSNSSAPSNMTMPTLNPLDGAAPPTPRTSGGYRPGTEMKHMASDEMYAYEAAAAVNPGPPQPPHQEHLPQQPQEQMVPELANTSIPEGAPMSDASDSV